MTNCGWCDQPQQMMLGTERQYHECIECGEEISAEQCDQYEGYCADCAAKEWI